ncbi:MAG: NYN domain-containing protein [Candidatus Kariarchaeaceae archaeon]
MRIMNISRYTPSYLRLGSFCVIILVFLTIIPTNLSSSISAQETDAYLTAIPAKTTILRGEPLDYTLSINLYTNTYPINLNMTIFGNNSSIHMPSFQLTNAVEQKSISWKNLMGAGVHMVNISGTTPDTLSIPLFVSFSVNVTYPIESIIRVNVENSVENIQLNINDPKPIFWEASNIGGTVSNNVIVRYIAYAPPFQAEGPWREFDLESLEPGETKQWSINAYASDYGVGLITYQAEYTDGDTLEEKVSPSYTLNMYAVPDLQVIVNYPEVGTVDDTMSVFINMTNESPITVNLWVSYSQTGNFFIQSTNDTSSISIEANDTISIYFLLLPKLPGIGQLTISIGLVGVQNLKLYDATLEITLNEKATGESTLLYFLIPIILILIAIIIGIFFYVRRFNFDFPLPLTLSETTSSSFFDAETDFTIKKAIVDGSNVAWDSTSKKGNPRVINLINMIKALSEVGIEEVLIVADASLRHCIDDERTLRKLSNKGVVKLLAARIQADQVILRLSEETGAMIVSNDLFREWRTKIKWIDERRIPFSIIQNKVLLHPPSEFLMDNQPKKDKQK